MVKGTPKFPSSTRSIKELYKDGEQKFRIFSLKELVAAANAFIGMLKIEEGGIKKVYMGTFSP